MNTIIESDSKWDFIRTMVHTPAVARVQHRNTGAARILVVDDEPEVVRGLVMRLNHAGFEVLTASDGFAATQLALSETPDLVLLDIGLPCGDGHTVARRLSENVKTMCIPVIFLSARTASLDRNRAAATGARDYITKPFKWERLLSAIEDALSPTREFDL